MIVVPLRKELGEVMNSCNTLDERELYVEKVRSAKYSINKALDGIDFEYKYLIGV
ncbi:hypothetical protein ACJDU8_24760 [Clostridium sp. WILCCON 0269]|uniref:Uncharacterized protein n=1 Tax=Candidatus Clostridium eludens TaxID=3381663 RepID=A0ABW8SRZ2_9CLOT